jgi:phosphohistidine phosphatase
MRFRSSWRERFFHNRDVAAMRRLILLRHSKSDHTPGVRDHDRTLNGRGRADAARVGAYMARHDLRPDRALCSPSKRTRETWDLASAAFAAPPAVSLEPRLYEGDPDTILDVLRDTGPKVHTLIVIAHNPGMQRIANALIASGDVEARERLQEKLPTSGLVVIDLAFDEWRRLHPASGRLDRFVTPRRLDDATE